MDEPIFIIPPDLTIGPSADVLPLAGEVNWGMEAFDVEKLRSLTDGRGIVVGVVDTGVDRAHPILTNCFDAADFTGSRSGPADTHGHGTHVTGTVGGTDPRLGFAPGSRTIHGKGLGDSGSGGGQGIADAIRWVVRKGASIVSMSLGSSSEDSRITGAIREVAAEGVWVVCAGGNSGTGTPNVDYPARSEHCISVAALDRDLTPATFSNSGDKIDTSGPGVDIWSAKPGGGYQRMSGTSMATPAVAGMLALYRSLLLLRSQPVPDVYGLRYLLSQRSTDIGEAGDDRRTGPGWITPLLLAVAATPDPPPVA